MDDYNNYPTNEPKPENEFTGSQNEAKPQVESNDFNYSYAQVQSDKAGYSQPTGSYYNPQISNGYQQNYYQPEINNQQPPKKGKAGKVILGIFIICVCVALAGLVSSAVGKTDLSSITQKSSQSSSGSTVDDVETKDSADVPTSDSSGNLTVAGVAENCMDSCVGISVYSEQAASYNYFYGYGQQNNSSSEPSLSGEGSGVLFSEANGKTYIITCAHVISGGDSFKVTLNDKKEYDAELVAYDSQTDIGVLSINKTGLKIAEFANSDKLTVGEQVVAIGCPGGIEFMNSITSGYVSALDRPVSSSIGYNNKCIQTDAAINPGNSGGALFNMQGQVVGINSSKIASTEYEGMGFAVPSSTAVATANSLIKSGYVEGRAQIGIEYTPLTNFNNSTAILSALESKGYKNAQGVMVVRTINDNSDLKNKDVKEYDMIVAVNGKTMTSTDVMVSLLSDSKPGDTVKLTMARITDDNELKIFEIECKLIEATKESK